MTDLANVKKILDELRGLHVNTPRDAAFASHFNRLLKYDAEGRQVPSALRFTGTAETRGVMVIDEPGGGKSTLVEHGLVGCAALQAVPGQQKHYLKVAVPSPATLKSVTRALLKDSGYPGVSKSREVWSMMEILRERILLLGIAVIWIDEAQDLFCADRKLILRALKSLMQGDAAVTIILSGTPALAEVVRSDPQVQRRFTTLILPRVDPQADREAISGLIETYCKRAGLEPPADRDLVDRLAHAARHLFGRTVENVVSAIECALMAGADALDIDHFAQVYAMSEGDVTERNVFLVEDWWNIRPGLSKDEEEVMPLRRRAKRR
jgi:hypothetical protein